MRETHHTTIDVVSPVPELVAAGTILTLKASVRCSCGCDLRARAVHIVASSGVVADGELTTYEHGLNATAELSAAAPREVGRHEWTVVLPDDRAEAIAHESTSAPIAFSTAPHALNAALWGAPMPAIVEQPFAIKLGLQCSASCQLAGQRFTIREAGTHHQFEGTLGNDPWPGTSALYWAEIGLSALPAEGVCVRSAACDLIGSDLPHETAIASFSVRAARRPEHTVTVSVVDAYTGTPVDDAEVRLGIYLTSTDASGIARMAIANGTYELTIRKDDYTAAPLTVTVPDIVDVVVRALAGETRSERERKLTTLEDYPWG